MSLEKTFGEKLIKAREDAGFSQTAFAEKIPVDRKTLAKWEKNYTFPNIEQIAVMADLTNLPIEFFIDGYLNDHEEDTEEKQIKKLQYQTNRNSEQIEQLRGNVRGYTEEMTTYVFSAIYTGLLILSGLRGTFPNWPFTVTLGTIPCIACIILCVWKYRKKKSTMNLLLFVPAIVMLVWNIYWTIERRHWGL